MTNTTYDILNRNARFVLPTLTMLVAYFFTEEELIVVLALLALVLGIILEISSRLYAKRNDGELIITEDQEGKRSYSLQLEKEPEELAEMDKILFKVQK